MPKTNIIKIPGEAIDEAAASVIKTLAGDTAKGLMAGGSNILGGLIGDRLKEWRIRNLIKVTATTAKFLEERGISLSDTKCLPNGDIYRLFEGASKTDESNVSDLWAGLLANAMNPHIDMSVNIQFTSILEQLTAYDVRVIDFIKYQNSKVHDMKAELPNDFCPYALKKDKEWEKKKNNHDKIKIKAVKDIKDKAVELKISNESNIQTSIENLVRLDIIFLTEFTADISESRLEQGYRTNEGFEIVDITALHNIIDEIVYCIQLNPKRLAKENPSGLFMKNKYLDLNYEFSSFGERFITACYV